MKFKYTLDNLKRFTHIKAAEEGDSPTIDIDKSELGNIVCGFHGLVNGRIVEIGFTEEEKQSLLNHNITHEKESILKWLADNDWKVNKIVVGEWTKEDPRWLSYLEERQIKRNRLDELV